MTTGRINQVTILNPGALGTRAQPPEGSGKYKAGSGTKPLPVAYYEGTRGTDAVSNRFNCPH